MHFEHRIHSPKVTLMFVIDSEPQLIRTCKTDIEFARLLSVFTLAVPLFRFTPKQNRLLIRLHTKYTTALFSKL